MGINVVFGYFWGSYRGSYLCSNINVDEVSHFWRERERKRGRRERGSFVGKVYDSEYYFVLGERYSFCILRKSYDIYNIK